MRTVSDCALCRRQIVGVNCLPTLNYQCPNCGRSLLLCPDCQGMGLECPTCEDTMRPAWEFRECACDQAKQKSISDYLESGNE